VSNPNYTVSSATDYRGKNKCSVDKRGLKVERELFQIKLLLLELVVSHGG
jgi:hypothetical protein